jgi:hypothetical protein
MNLETFTKIIQGIETHDKNVHNAYTLGIDLLNFGEGYYSDVVKPLLTESFGTEGVNWIEWYLYERDLISGTQAKAWDEHDNEICQDIPSLYNTVKSINK